MIVTILRQVGAYAQKDLNLQLRFKVDFVAYAFVPALINLGLFSTVYFGFFKSGAPSLTELSNSNFVAFALLGALTATLFNSGINAFQYRFVLEKYWETALGILASPLSPWGLLLGVMISEAVKFSIVLAVMLTLAYVFWPVSIGTLLTSLSILALMYIMISGFALIRGALYLVNENLDPILHYFMVGTGYLSCFYFPASFLPSFLQQIAYINPIYFVVATLRAFWLGLPLSVPFIAVSLMVGAIGPVIGTYAFAKVWRNLDVTGY